MAVSIQMTLKEERIETVSVELINGALTQENLGAALNKNFINNSDITALEFPEDYKNVTSIGRAAFYGCTSLREINIPNSVTSIDDCAFRDCTNLTSIKIPGKVKSIGHGAFYGCTSLTSIKIPDGVMSIGDSTFSGCKSLTEINIPDKVESIGDSTFSGCTSLTSIKIPDKVESIGDSAFSCCTRLASVTIPEGVRGIEEYAFSGCESLEKIVVPNTVQYIRAFAFQECKNISSFIIPDNVTEIGRWAFDRCTSLKRIAIGNSVQCIETVPCMGRLGSSEDDDNNEFGIFSSCKVLEEVIVPDDDRWRMISQELDKSKIANGQVKIYTLSKKLENLYGDVQAKQIKTFDYQVQVLFAMQYDVVENIIVTISIGSGSVMFADPAGRETKINIIGNDYQPCHLGAILGNFVKATGHPLAMCNFFVEGGDNSKGVVQRARLFSPAGLEIFNNAIEKTSSLQENSVVTVREVFKREQASGTGDNEEEQIRKKQKVN